MIITVVVELANILNSDDEHIHNGKNDHNDAFHKHSNEHNKHNHTHNWHLSAGNGGCP